MKELNLIFKAVEMAQSKGAYSLLEARAILDAMEKFSEHYESLNSKDNIKESEGVVKAEEELV